MKAYACQCEPTNASRNRKWNSTKTIWTRKFHFHFRRPAGQAIVGPRLVVSSATCNVTSFYSLHNSKIRSVSNVLVLYCTGPSLFWSRELNISVVYRFNSNSALRKPFPSVQRLRACSDSSWQPCLLFHQRVRPIQPIIHCVSKKVPTFIFCNFVKS